MNFKLISALAAGLLATAPGFAAAVTIDFEGTESFGSIGDFYNGGSGANYGASFGGGALGLSNDDLGPYFSNAPSGSSVMTAVDDDAALSVAKGFSGQVSFWYSSTEDTSVGLYSGVDGSGDLLSTITLEANATNGGCSSSPLCYWSLVTLDFAGVAQSLQFGSAKYVAAFDNVTVAPVPLPAAAWLMLSALGGMGVFARRKKAA